MITIAFFEFVDFQYPTNIEKFLISSIIHIFVP